MRTVLLALGIVVAVWLAAVLFLFLVGKSSAARELVSLLPNLLALFRGLLRDPRVPTGTKLWLGFAIAWFLSPIDLIPEFIPIAGPLDDAIVAALVLRHVLKRAGRDVVESHWRGNPATLRLLLRVGGLSPQGRDQDSLA
jgi:uncharacterized membrane protein YkvA (DUF1232 family)